MEVGGWRLEVRGWRLEVGGKRLEVGGWRLEIGDWRLEVECWRLEVGGWYDVVDVKTSKNMGIQTVKDLNVYNEAFKLAMTIFWKPLKPKR